MARLILFDIDGTLISTGGAGSRALDRAMIELTGITDGFRGIDFAGKTDISILREGLLNLGLDSQDNLPNSLLNRYLVYLRTEVARGDGRVKPGVRELLEALRAIDEIYLGLLTGNIEEGARIKLDPFGLNAFFPFGAYGSDEEDRNRLLPIAVRRLRASRGVSVDYGDCLVIGDTPRDVECARIYGARSIAVATGPYSLEVLKQTEADLVVSDLSDTTRIPEWMHELGD